MILRKDPRAEEEIMKPVVFLVVFVAVTALLVGFITQFYQENAFGGSADYSTGYSTIGGITYDMLDPADGYQVTPDDIVRWIDMGDPESEEFPVFTFEDLQLQVCNENIFYAPWDGFKIHEFRDFIWFKVSYGWWTVKVCALPFETILENYQDETNTSINDIALGHRSYTVFIQAPGPTLGFEPALYSGNLNISVGVNLEDALAHNSMWSTLGQVLTMQLPDTHWIVNLLIAIPLWTAIGVLAFIVIKGLVPW